jgi:hypothetical protein
VIVVAVRLYLRYRLSYRDVEDLLAERGIQVDRVTVNRWVQRFTPAAGRRRPVRRHAPGDRWFVDETYIKVSGVWRYRGTVRQLRRSPAGLDPSFPAVAVAGDLLVWVESTTHRQELWSKHLQGQTRQVASAACTVSGRPAWTMLPWILCLAMTSAPRQETRRCTRSGSVAGGWRPGGVGVTQPGLLGEHERVGQRRTTVPSPSGHSTAKAAVGDQHGDVKDATSRPRL